jgi:hypothetical protein
VALPDEFGNGGGESQNAASVPDFLRRALDHRSNVPESRSRWWCNIAKSLPSHGAMLDRNTPNREDRDSDT